MAFPLRFDRKAACVKGGGIAVHWARQLVIVTGRVDSKLHCYKLHDGVESSVVGRGYGAGDMQFGWFNGGMCVTPNDTLLISDWFNDRVPEVDLDEVDHFVRVFGQRYGPPEIRRPRYVDCNGVHVAVSEMGDHHRVSVLSYADGSLVGRFGNDSLSYPFGIKLLADGSGVVVAYCWSDRVALLSLGDNALGTAPQAVLSHDDLQCPTCIAQCAVADGEVVVLVVRRGATGSVTRLVKISSRGGVLDSVDMAGTDDGQFSDLTGIVTLPGGGLVALDSEACRFQVFTSLAPRMGWIRAAVCWQRRH